MNRRRVALVAAALALVAVGTRQPTADLQILTHDTRDVNPRRMQAVLDLGVVGVKLLVTWTAGQLR